MIPPMLAHKYEHKRFSLPAYVQPKLDGLRGLTQWGRFFSRDGIEWDKGLVYHVSQSLHDQEIVLDGEWYRHGWSLQVINSAIGVKRQTITTRSPQVSFNVFDSIFYDLPFIERWWRAKQVVEQLNNPKINMVPVHEVTTKEEVDSWFAHYRSKGYEGVMVRMGEGGYTKPHDPRVDQDNRCWTMLKRKGVLDEKFIVTDVTEGRDTEAGGKFVGMVGALVCGTADGKSFNVGSGLSDAERTIWWDNPPIGCWADVQFERYSDDGIPLKPTLKLLHE